MLFPITELSTDGSLEFSVRGGLVGETSVDGGEIVARVWRYQSLTADRLLFGPYHIELWLRVDEPDKPQHSVIGLRLWMDDPGDDQHYFEKGLAAFSRVLDFGQDYADLTAIQEKIDSIEEQVAELQNQQSQASGPASRSYRRAHELAGGLQTLRDLYFREAALLNGLPRWSPSQTAALEAAQGVALSSRGEAAREAEQALARWGKTKPDLGVRLRQVNSSLFATQAKLQSREQAAEALGDILEQLHSDLLVLEAVGVSTRADEVASALAATREWRSAVQRARARGCQFGRTLDREDLQALAHEMPDETVAALVEACGVAWEYARSQAPSLREEGLGTRSMAQLSNPKNYRKELSWRDLQRIEDLDAMVDTPAGGGPLSAGETEDGAGAESGVGSVRTLGSSTSVAGLSPGLLDWKDAKRFCSGSLSGVNAGHLPTAKELEQLDRLGQLRIAGQSAPTAVWTSDARGTDKALVYLPKSRKTSAESQVHMLAHVLCLGTTVPGLPEATAPGDGTAATAVLASAAKEDERPKEERLSGTPASSEDVLWDSARGLAWTRRPGISTQSWRSAAGYCEALRAGGLSGWALPSTSQLGRVEPQFVDEWSMGGSADLVFWASDADASPAAEESHAFYNLASRRWTWIKGPHSRILGPRPRVLCVRKLQRTGE